MSQLAVGQAATHRAATRMPPLHPAAVTAWVAPFGLTVFLAMHNGGYDLVVRSQVGIALWWLVLLGCLLGVLPAVRLPWTGWAGLALLGGFVVWTALSLGWTESHERTAVELGKVAAYLGIFALSLAAQGRVALRHSINGAGAAIALVGLFAVLSRLHPAWFTPTDTDRFYKGNVRLDYPLGYWNALAGLMAMGIPLVLHMAATARLLVSRAAAAAALPVMALCIFLTVSRGSIGMVAAGVIVFLVLAPERIHRLLSLAVAGAGSAVLIAAAHSRGGVTQAGTDAVARHQDSELLGLMVLVCAGVALLQVGVSLAERHATLPAVLVPRRRPAAIAGAAGLVLVLLAFVGAGGPHWVEGEWQQFKTSSAPPAVSQDSGFSRLGSLTGNGRYQYWQAAAAERDRHPLKGSGSGTFEYFWARHGVKVNSLFVRDAHSLWMETQGELGIVGLVLIAGFFLLTLLTGATRALREAEPHRRLAYAAATAGVAAFAAAATVEWVWEIAVLPLVTLLLVGLILGRGPVRWVRLETRRPPMLPARVVLSVVTLGAIVVIAVPLASTSALRDSQAAARRSDPALALTDARTAARIEPAAATPLLQQALVYEQTGALTQAAALARGATLREPTNWRTWLTLSRVEAERSHAKASVRAYHRARSLNPNSSLFAR